jgi:hypothetical protein
MTQIKIEPGICGMPTVIEVDTAGKFAVTIKITSECEKVLSMSNSLSYIKVGDALKPHVSSLVYKCAAEYNLCASCVVPAGILKAVEVESGLALPRPVTITFQTKTQK